jgi:hypothetical protein
MDMGNVIIGDIIPRVDNGINGIILFIILMLMCFGVLEITLLSHIFQEQLNIRLSLEKKDDR